jgi:hypothetical protein
MKIEQYQSTRMEDAEHVEVVRDEAAIAQMKTSILAFFEERQSGITFVELEEHVKGFAGDVDWCTQNGILIWMRMSSAAISAMVELTHDDEIEPHSTSFLSYLADGHYPGLPIAKSVTRKYKNLHWLPLGYSLPKSKRTGIGKNPSEMEGWLK